MIQFIVCLLIQGVNPLEFTRFPQAYPYLLQFIMGFIRPFQYKRQCRQRLLSDSLSSPIDLIAWLSLYYA